MEEIMKETDAEITVEEMIARALGRGHVQAAIPFPQQ